MLFLIMLGEDSAGTVCARETFCCVYITRQKTHYLGVLIGQPFSKECRGIG